MYAYWILVGLMIMGYFHMQNDPETYQPTQLEWALSIAIVFVWPIVFPVLIVYDLHERGHLPGWRDRIVEYLKEGWGDPPSGTAGA